MSSCPICASKLRWKMPYEQTPDAQKVLDEHGKADTYEWYLCKQCGNAYPNEQPELPLLKEIWALNRKLEDPNAPKEKVILDRRIAISKLGGQRNLQVYGSLLNGAQGRFLDIACGYGETVRAFADAGWDAYGIDTDANTKKHHDAIGIQSEICPFEEAKVAGPFDLIHISHAIYFITDPMTFIHRVRDLLTSDGYFCVSTADFQSSFDPGLPNYAHTFYPTKVSMLCALELAGFKARHIKSEKGTVYIVAQRTEKQPNPNTITATPYCTWIGWKTKSLRYAMIGKPVQTLIPLIKKVLGR